MASIKVKFRPSTVADHEGTIYYQIIHERKVRQLLTEYKIFPAEWDEKRSKHHHPLKNTIASASPGSKSFSFSNRPYLLDRYWDDKFHAQIYQISIYGKQNC